MLRIAKKNIRKTYPDVLGNVNLQEFAKICKYLQKFARN